jgi:hypothetical protein
VVTKCLIDVIKLLCLLCESMLLALAFFGAGGQKEMRGNKRREADL